MPEDEHLAESDGSLERIRRRLYAQDAPAPLTPPPLSTFQNQRAPVAWKPPVRKPKAKKHFSWTVLFLGICVVFFLIAGGISFFFLIQGGLAVSNNNIVITVTGLPTTLASGSTVTLGVTIQNKNPAAISGTDIAVAFPDGTRSANDVTQALVRYADTLGTIPAGGIATTSIQAVLFGSVNQSISIPVTFQYNTPNSNVLFVKQQNLATTITSSPLTVTAQSVGTIASNQPFTIALTVTSSAPTTLNNIAVDAQYPSDFTVQNVNMDGGQTSTSTNSSQSFITLGTLTPGQQRIINITGALNGTDNDQEAFGFTVGTVSADGTQSIAVPYASQTSNVTITAPFLGVTLSMNHGNANTTVVTPGQAIAGVVNWVNSLSTTLSNAQISIQLSGNALDPTKVTTTNGYYDSSTNTILFTQQSESSLALLNPGDTGNGEFTLSTKTGAALTSLRDPTIQLAVTVTGQPTGQSAETITNTLTNTIQVATDLELASQLVHSNGPFANSGPWPPVPNSPTTYTVELAATNTVSPVGGATATMILPQYVNYTGQVTPNDGSITYNTATRTVTWQIGDVAAGTGTVTQPITAAFQISYTPSDTQVGTSPILVGNQTMTGTDRFTNAQVGNTATALTTQTPNDPAYKQLFGTVGN